MNFFDQFPVQAFNHLELLANQVVEGFIIGKHKSPFHGFSVEFAEHRLYNIGETTKDLDWKVYARTDKLFIKKFEEETNLRCQIVIDTSSSMYFPEEKLNNGLVLNKLKFSALGAACIMNILRKQRDAFGISLFDEKLNFQSQTKSSTTHYQLLLSFLEKWIHDFDLNRKSSTAQALHEIADQIHKRSMVVIFSDMFDDTDKTDDLFGALQHLKHNKHEVLLFHVVDKKLEIDFDFENRPYQFVDMETGEKVRLQAHQIKDRYVEKMQEYHNSIKNKCIQYRIDYHEADINQGYDYILQSFLGKRKKMQ
ncbi:MAG: DUF58 domain-containing protein [Saprospiraceae bacterium]|nr:DUF58 domain-containing protein [Candidatus Vicinibacter affinis]MBK7799772.1 DUF58 domain-containing protein [Candidatus Vicinibacter affinis]MBK8404033.1 DUF58 domain-containing protein [Candidatus Vicinibacter affinis]MBK8641612.1 DUF58 domain-containing protein [Candidatus Vicinibacter affinis]MBK9961387.1 DUF58 domain-containing protein [Candidatus Vicinibacter affinis]